MGRRGPSHFAVAQIIYLAAWLTLSAPWLFGSFTIPYDAKAHFQAQIQFLANALHSGQSPFWAPHVFVGSPHIADPQSLIFSPAILLAYLDAIPSFRQLDAYVLVLLALSGLAVIKLFEDRGWHPAGAVLAAIGVSFGASAAWRIQHIGQIQSYAVFCFALFLLDRALRRSSWLWGTAAGAAIGIMLAEPNQVALLGCYLLMGLVLADWLGSGAVWQTVRRSLRPLAAAGLATILVAGVPLLFAALFVLSSNRPAIPFEEAAHGSLHPASLLTAVVGDLFGALDPKVDYWGPYSESWNPNELTLSQNMSQVYIGALPALLILTLGLSRGVLWAREIRFITLAALAMLLYALGSFTPVFRIFYDLVPGVSFFRRPADATFMLGAMLSIFAGYLTHRWLSSGLPDPRRTWIVGKAVLVLAIMVIAAIVAGHEHKLALATKPILLAGIWLAASTVVVHTVRLKAMAHPVAAVAAVAGLLTLDLAVNNGPNESTASASADYDVLDPNTRNETVRFLKERVRRGTDTEWRDRVELVGLGFEWPNCAMVHGFEHTLGYNPLRMSVVSAAIGAKDHVAGPDQRHFSPLFPSYRSTMANLLGLRFVASGVPIERIDRGLARDALRLLARTKHAYIYENTEALPRVLFARRVFEIDFARLIADGTWPDFNPLDTVLLDRSQTSYWTTPDDAGTSAVSGARARIAHYENTLVDVDVEAPVAGFLVLNDLWHAWWKATIDGYPALIHKANVMFRAVHVPPGRHRVRFEFQPFSGAIAELREKAFHGR
jgi:hypothetical protein